MFYKPNDEQRGANLTVLYARNSSQIPLPPFGVCTHGDTLFKIADVSHSSDEGLTLETSVFQIRDGG